MSFLEPANINLLWDILLDTEGEFIMKNNGQYKQAIKNQFLNITRNFNEVEKSSGMSLMAMNKKIITVLMNEWVPMLKKQENDIHKSKPLEKVLFTAEDIQKSRKMEFEKDLIAKESEFRSAMAQPVPPTIDFNEKKDEPIGEMEKLIAETIAQRNFDINQFKTPNEEEAKKWLKTTSKEETRYIKIGEPLTNQITVAVELPTQKKQLSWASKLEQHDNVEISVADSIFDKLKPLKEEKSYTVLLEEKMDLLLNKMDKLIDLFAKNNN